MMHNITYYIQRKAKEKKKLTKTTTIFHHLSTTHTHIYIQTILLPSTSHQTNKRFHRTMSQSLLLRRHSRLLSFTYRHPSFNNINNKYKNIKSSSFSFLRIYSSSSTDDKNNNQQQQQPSSSSSSPPPHNKKKLDFFRRNLPASLFKESIVASPSFNRWLVPPAAIGTHLSIGSVYAWSLFNDPLTRELGVICSSASDWSLQAVVPIFSTSIVCLGLSAAIAGKWLEDVGPRLVGCIAATLWGGGFLLGSMGISTHDLTLLYLGYGVLGGCGLGLGYVSPVSTLIRWFPDRRGMATGMAIMGFGGGAMLAAPVKKKLLEYYFEAPTYLGKYCIIIIYEIYSRNNISSYTTHHHYIYI